MIAVEFDHKSSGLGHTPKDHCCVSMARIMCRTYVVQLSQDSILSWHEWGCVWYEWYLQQRSSFSLPFTNLIVSAYKYDQIISRTICSIQHRSTSTNVPLMHTVNIWLNHMRGVHYLAPCNYYTQSMLSSATWPPPPPRVTRFLKVLLSVCARIPSRCKLII